MMARRDHRVVRVSSGFSWPVERLAMPSHSRFTSTSVRESKAGCIPHASYPSAPSGWVVVVLTAAAAGLSITGP